MKLSKQHSNYQSEITQFIAALKEKNPNLEESQRAGRALLWDKSPIDLEQQARNQDSRINQQAYPYQNKVR
jgi:aspartate ammonia-lyase